MLQLPLVLTFFPTVREQMGENAPSYGRGTGIPSPVDVHVGARLRQRRTLLGMSQTTLGDAVGLTFQQMQKYEKGTNRISASRLFDFARVLDVPIEYFFSDMPAGVADILAGKRRSRTKQPPSYDLDPMAKRETLELVRAYYKIADPKIRKRLFELAKAAGAAASKDS